MDAIPNLKPGEVAPFLLVLEHVRDSGLLERYDIDISARLMDVETRIRELAAETVHNKYQDLCSSPDTNAAIPLLFLSDEIENNAKKLDKRFSEPILGCVSSFPPADSIELTTGWVIQAD